MAFTEFEKRRHVKVADAFLELRRPPPDVRDKVDLGYRISGQSVEIFEIRPRWDVPGATFEIPVAKTTFIRTTGLWRVYWMRRDLRWHRYDPDPEVERLEEFLDIVGRDEWAHFFG